MINKKIIISSYIKQFLSSEIPYFKPRNIDFNFIENENIRKAYTIIGPRRAGKSHFCFQIIDNLLKNGVKKENILYFLLENDEIFPLELADLNTILETYFEITGKINEKVYIFLDEIQEVPNFAKFIRKVLDNYPLVEIIITGSSSKLLSKEIDTSMRGRTVSYEILPLNYEEYLNWKDFTVQKNLSKTDILKLKNLDYNLKFGLFPEIVLETKDENKIKYLKNYFDLIFYKDVVERSNIKSIKNVKSFRKILLSNISNFISINSIGTLLKVENNTLTNWLNAFLDSYLFFELKCFSFSTYNVEKSQSKIYTIDNGFYNSIFANIKKDDGILLENIVFLELRKIGLIENENIFYYKNSGFDIDFIVYKDLDIYPLQVCYELNKGNINREVIEYEKFLAKFNFKGYLLLGEDYIEDLKLENIIIIKLMDIGKIFLKG